MRSARVKFAIGVAVLGVVVTTAAAVAGGGEQQGQAQRVPGGARRPDDGDGTFRLSISHTEPRINYRLRYSGLEGGDVL